MMDAIDIDLGTLDAQDEAELVIRHPKTREPTTWVWTFYGPAHAKTRALADRVSREALRRSVAERQARINGEPLPDEDPQTPDQIRAETVDSIVARTKAFTPVKLGDQQIVFSPDAARALLLDRKKAWLFVQIVNYLKAEENFIQPSAPS
ncbi:branched-chain amino acid ABC transporter [Bradyrhizobium sp. SZCCHNR2032]|uniref:branched-chain amino acid ABC transporter n=1 Tax=Bradyrhizobium sp. SZCCHNR2032 TaxID=3057384 RepID=UPI0029163094|nr:branched-chain amino acid ABC transporter [Bradyrhizobium sp. SZCCHNR2032]